MSQARRQPTAAVALAIDVLAVLVFVAIGRRSHNETGNVFVGAAKVAAPFLIGLAVGWLVTRAHRSPLALRTGVGVWASTVVIGLLLRRLVFDRGIAIAFVIVATFTLALLELGWRAIAARMTGRSNAAA